MADKRIPTPTGYRDPGDAEPEPEPEPEYMTTVGLVEMRDKFNSGKMRYDGYVCRKATDPIVPPGGHERWRLLSTDAHTVEFYESKPSEPKYRACFIALIWTWQRVHPE